MHTVAAPAGWSITAARPVSSRTGRIAAPSVRLSVLLQGPRCDDNHAADHDPGLGQGDSAGLAVDNDEILVMPRADQAVKGVAAHCCCFRPA